MYPNPPRAPFLAAADPGITPAGWYTVADGRTLWWDGHRWTIVPEPGQAVQPTRAVTSVPVQTSHTFHLILTLVTCGLWAPVWAVVAVLNSLSKKKQTTTYR